MPSVTTTGRISLALSLASMALATVNILNSGVNVKIVKKTPTVAIQNEKILELKSTSGAGLSVTGSGSLTASGKILSQRTTDLGWTVKAGANTACNTTCTSACVFGEDTGVIGTLLQCTDATADVCICAGAN